MKQPCLLPPNALLFKFRCRCRVTAGKASFCITNLTRCQPPESIVARAMHPTDCVSITAMLGISPGTIQTRPVEYLINLTYGSSLCSSSTSCSARLGGRCLNLLNSNSHNSNYHTTGRTACAEHRQSQTIVNLMMVDSLHTTSMA